MKAECRKLGAKIIYASLDKLVVTTGKASVVAAQAAQAAVDYIAKAIVAKPLFENISLMPLQYWTFLLWMNSSNYGGIVIQDAGGEGGASGEPSIEMLWNMKEYLPPLVQSQFELIVAEFIYKLAGFHAQLRAKNPHIAHSSGDAAMHNEVIEDDDEETEKTGNSSSVTAAKGTFYKRLIGQYFTRKLLEAVPQIRDACSPAQQRHHDNPQACFPRLPGSTLHLPGSRAEAALEFVKYITTVFALDTPASNFVRIMRRNLLVLLDVGEFAEASQFVNPCERLVLSRVVCDFCNYCRDMDFCRDADLLPSTTTSSSAATAAAGGEGSSVQAPEWECLGCGCAYDRLRIEERLIELLHEALLAYQMQDLVCGKCRLMKQDNFSVQCVACAGKYRTMVSPAAVRAQIQVYLDVAEMNRLPMLHDLAKWAYTNTGVTTPR
ncbi:DNA polymerase epsilon catalytic subunit [Coemansia aciculifera]|nr:DNA polymerase epsilon catalytic subunit [Coemansia aciculifera]